MKDVYGFNEIIDGNFELYIDTIYEGGKRGNAGDDPIPKLVGVGNSGGFRIKKSQYDKNKIAYVILYKSGKIVEWPDDFNVETGNFVYYGDNRKAGREIHMTKGNKILREVFDKLHNNEDERREIPPFFVFQKTGEGRDVKFLGLAAPGSENNGPGEDLIAIWKSKDNQRFQNYKAIFTILDTGSDVISKEWLKALVEDENHEKYEPQVWKDFVKSGVNGFKILKAPRVTRFRKPNEQKPSSKNKINLLKMVKDYFDSFGRNGAYRFEKFAAKIVEMSDRNYDGFDLTRPWRDGGRDGIGKYKIGTKYDYIMVECALEAKCYDLKNSVGVKETSRLISRIRHRQFGILVTTSYLTEQAYKEIIEDDHPIIVFSGNEIVEQLDYNGLNDVEKLKNWLSDNF